MNGILCYLPTFRRNLGGSSKFAPFCLAHGIKEFKELVPNWFLEVLHKKRMALALSRRQLPHAFGPLGQCNAATINCMHLVVPFSCMAHFVCSLQTAA